MKLLRRSDLAIIALAAVLFSTWLGLSTDESPSYSETNDQVQAPQVSRQNSTADAEASTLGAETESTKNRSTDTIIPSQDIVDTMAEADNSSNLPPLVAAPKPQAIKAKQADPANIPPGVTDPRTLRRFGRGAPFDLEDLPDGNLKTQVANLSPKAQKKAMKWLHSFNFSGIDAVDSLNADVNGGVFYSCYKGNCNHKHHAIKTSETIETEALTEPGVSAAAVPISSPPIYNSKPGSEFTMYLDFNGAVIEGKAWNTSNGVPSWTAKAYSSDGDLTTFSDTEQTFMRRVWERIAEDYAPFDINVTTDVAFDPDTYTGDKNKVAWNLFCPRVDANSVNLPHAGSGGIAYVGVFGNSNYFSSYQPAFTKAETNESPSNAAEAGSHEIGHNMGLSHDTRSDEGYYGGHTGAGAPTWGPIMGTGYGRNLSQWSKGEYYDSKHASWNGSAYDNNPNTNDDLLIISDRTAYRTDDHGDSNGAATELTLGSGGEINQTGIISETSEVDVLSFSTGAGSVTINADTFRSDSSTWGGNLDINLELYDAGGSLVASNNPATDVNASITATLSAGTYYIHIKPSAAGNASGTGSPYDSNNSTRAGYTVYASLGQYTVTGTAVVPGIGIAETGSTDVTEGGATDTYSLVLGTQPSSNVTVTISPDSQVNTDTASVTFTTSNWDTPQVVTVTAVDDSANEGSHTGTISHSSSSGDPAFNGIGVGSVIANITDNDNILVTSPNGGETLLKGSTSLITWSSLAPGNVKIELFKGGALDSVLSSSTANNGSFSWNISSGLAGGSDYSIRITSLTNGSIFDSSDANFSLAELVYSESFEADWGIWTQDVLDDLDWTRTNTATPSADTGPTAAQDGSYYIFQESSNTNGVEYVASISATFDLSALSSGSFNFYYHMYGAAMGTLELEVSTNGGSTWTNLWTRSGDQGNAWFEQSIDLASVVGNGSVIFRFTGTESQDFRSDFALDNITITGVSQPVTAGPIDHFAISTISSPQLVNNPITGITLTAQDASDVTVSSFTGTVNFSGTAGITGTSGNFVNGVLTGLTVVPTAVGSNLTLIVDDGAGHSGSATFSVLSVDPLGEALDTPNRLWSTSGNQPWFSQTTTTNDTEDAAQSGSITDNQVSSMETTLEGSGTLTFYWKVSSEANYDFLRFYINGVEQTGSLAPISGNVDWVQKTVTIPSGSNVVRWSYTKDGSVSSNSDTAYVDQVVFAADLPFQTWSGGTTTFTADSNQDGVLDGMAWLLGASHPGAKAQSLLPVGSSPSGNDLVMTFTCLNAANRGSSVLNLQYSQDLGNTDLWSSNTVVVPDVTSTVGGVSFVITPNGNVNNVQATIPAATSSQFGRLMGTE